MASNNFGHSHRDVAVVLSGITQIQQEKREYEKALELYEGSLCAGRAALGEDHSEIAMLLNQMKNFHFEQEQLASYFTGKLSSPCPNSKDHIRQWSS